MSQTPPEAYGPKGDPSRHLALAELESRFEALAPAPAEVGRLDLILRRLPDGSRELPESVLLSVEEGVPGDRWSRRRPLDPEKQLAVIRRDVAELLANGQHLELFGDNLFVHLDVSAGNLSTGTRLAVGDAAVEVTPFPHNGCSKLSARFGNDALRAVQAPATRSQNRRGIYWKVVRTGEAAVGSEIRVLSRAPAAGG